MEIVTENRDQTVILRVNGRVDEKGAEELKNSFSALSLSGISQVHVDFQNLQYIGSSGIGKLLLFYKNLGVQHIQLRVINTPPAIHELMKELKLDTVFSIEQ